MEVTNLVVASLVAGALEGASPVVGTQVGAYPVEVSPSPSSPEDASRVVACHPLIKAVEHRAAFAPEVLLVLLVLQVLLVHLEA